MEPGLPPYRPDEVSYAGPPRRRDRRVEITLIVIAAIVLTGAVLLFIRSPGPPTTPVGVQVEALTCEEPCERITPTVTVSWTPPESGADPTGYRVIRDDSPLQAAIDASELAFVDETVTIGETYDYQVIALSSEGDSQASAPLEATVPTPPDEAARLAGIYRVELTVESARSIGAAFGIENPIPGKRGTDRWAFSSICADDEVACPSTWSGLERGGEIVPSGTSWKGTIDGRPAQCGSDERVPAPIDIDLRAVGAGVFDSAWVVSAFRGTVTVSFSCPGFPPASATVAVNGSL